jgi:hypothetical protein
LKRHWEREAPTYDRRMGFFERVLFRDGREWVCSRASKNGHVAYRLEASKLV